MISQRLTCASRQIAFMLIWLLLCPGAVLAREFTVQILSPSNGNYRMPSIGDTGLVAWQGYPKNEANQSLHQRPDVIQSPDATRVDIFTWQDGTVSNLTREYSQIVGRSQRPKVFQNTVVFEAWFSDDSHGGIPFKLTPPPKTREMRQMESDYPELFDPPLPAPISAVEAAANEGNTNRTEEVNIPEPEEETNPTNSLQHQMWRHGGTSSDIVAYKDGDYKRITPGTRQFSFPVISEAGIAFQCARGWPYGYELLSWEPGATNLTQITTNYFYVLNPDLQGQDLVFQAWDGNDYEIFRYNYETKQLEQITNNQFDDISPVVWGGEIAWIAHPTVTAEIFFIRDGVIRKISEGTEDNGAPSIWNGRVVWRGYDDTDLEIYYFNGNRTIKLTSNTWDDLAPDFRDGMITWMSYVDNWDAEIMILDLSDNIAVQVSDNDLEDSYPQTAGEKVVWQTITDTGTMIQMATPTAPRADPIN